jgi:hypothetical protein
VSALEITAVITTEVSFLKFFEALARAGLVGRRDAERGVLVIEPVPALCRGCGGTGIDEDAICDLCNGAGREAAARPREPSTMLYARAAII